MKFRKTLRIILTILVAPLSLPPFWLIYSFFGLTFMLAVMALLSYPFAWLMEDKDPLDFCKESIELAGMSLTAPFVFWHHFIMGRDSFKEIS